MHELDKRKWSIKIITRGVMKLDQVYLPFEKGGPMKEQSSLNLLKWSILVVFGLPLDFSNDHLDTLKSPPTIQCSLQRCKRSYSSSQNWSLSLALEGPYTPVNQQEKPSLRANRIEREWLPSMTLSTCVDGSFQRMTMPPALLTASREAQAIFLELHMDLIN